MNSGTFSVGGGIVMWKLGDRFSRTEIHSVLSGWSGFQKYTPSTRTPGAVLKEGMSHCWGNMMVRQMGDSSTFSLQEEVRGKDVHDTNVYVQYGAATILKSGGKYQVITEGRITQNETDLLQKYYDDHKEMVTHHQVSKSLVDLLTSQFDAESARDMGGVYWVPKDVMDDVEKLTDQIKGCTKRGNTRFYIFTARKDDRMLDAVQDIVQENAMGRIAEIKEDVLQDGAGEVLVRNRLSEIESIKRRLERYQNRLGAVLDDADTALQDAKAVALQAALRAATAKREKLEASNA